MATLTEDRRLRWLSVGILFVLILGSIALTGTLVGGSDGEESATELTFESDEPLELDRPTPVVTGETERAPGTEVQVVVESVPDADEEPFYASQTVSVTGDNSFAAAFELSEISPGTTAVVTVFDTSSGEQLAKSEAVVSVPWRSVEPGESLVSFDDSAPQELDVTDPVVSGNAAVDSGTNLELQLQTEPGTATHLFETETVTAGENGAFEQRLDVGTVEPGTAATLIVRKPEQSVPLSRTEVVFRPENGEPPSTAELVEVDEEQPYELRAGSNRLTGTAKRTEPGDQLEVTISAANLDVDGLPVTESVTVDRAGQFVLTPELGHIEPGVGLRIDIDHPETVDSETFTAVVVED